MPVKVFVQYFIEFIEEADGVYIRKNITILDILNDNRGERKSCINEQLGKELIGLHSPCSDE